MNGTGSRSCVLWPITPVQQRWSEIHFAPVSLASRLSLPRYSKSRGSVEPIDSETPCITIG